MFELIVNISDPPKKKEAERKPQEHTSNNTLLCHLSSRPPTFQDYCKTYAQRRGSYVDLL
jgi:hypothetical protein